MSESAEESEGDMSSLTTGFAARMHKQDGSAQRETTPSSNVSYGKCVKRSRPNEEVMSVKLIYVLSPFHMLF